MGEYAEYMINGDDCQPKPKRGRNPNAPFVMQNSSGSKHAFKFWLKERKYNAWSIGHMDKKGQRMIGLSWEYNPESDWTKHDRRGLVICRDDAAHEAALEIIEKYSQ